MTQTRLENLMTLEIHKEILDKDKTDLIQAAIAFVKPDSTFCKANIYDNFRYILLVATYEYTNIWQYQQNYCWISYSKRCVYCQFDCPQRLFFTS